MISGMHGFIKYVSNFRRVHQYPSNFCADENTQQDNWFMPSQDTASTGVAIRVDSGFFRLFPYENRSLIPFEAAVRRLNPVVAVKIRSAAVHAAIRKM